MSNQIELRHLIYFSTLAEELHFRKAAERLFISQPGLTRQIKQMEEIYGAVLFERGKRSVQLTNAGQYLKSEVDILLNQLDNIKTQIKKKELKVRSQNYPLVLSDQPPKASCLICFISWIRNIL